MDKFVVVDIETANPNLTSICQIGIAIYHNGALVKTWDSLINPCDYFDPMNICIHGITPSQVKNAPTIIQVKDQILSLFSKYVICSYGAFDRVSLTRLFPEIDNEWLDIMRVVRRSWNNKFSEKGYGLAKVAKYLNIRLENHHNALDDAIIAGEILNRAICDSEQDLSFWLSRIKKPMDIEKAIISRIGNPDGILFGETVVFTGELSIPRREAAEKAAIVGCNVVDGVSKKVTMLVIGIQDKDKLRGKELSNKEIKAQELITKGHNIMILSESDFFNLINE
ncbi:exonuclease domain-containing protein [Testudinibacter sp. P80/BLE/0925]|uniref:exonuclease domain-containing protein n=1 Tax=Testudinibacter sp. TW-1 TaxID=3417757 RepID=UPI003D360634